MQVTSNRLICKSLGEFSVRKWTSSGWQDENTYVLTYSNINNTLLTIRKTHLKILKNLSSKFNLKFKSDQINFIPKTPFYLSIQKQISTLTDRPASLDKSSCLIYALQFKKKGKERKKKNVRKSLNLLRQSLHQSSFELALNWSDVSITTFLFCLK